MSQILDIKQIWNVISLKNKLFMGLDPLTYDKTTMTIKTAVKRGGKIMVQYDQERDTFILSSWIINVRAKNPCRNLKTFEDIYLDQIDSLLPELFN